MEALHASAGTTDSPPAAAVYVKAAAANTDFKNKSLAGRLIDGHTVIYEEFGVLRSKQLACGVSCWIVTTYCIC